MHTYIHTYIHPSIHTCIHTYIHAYIRAYIHTYLLTCIHTYIQNLHTYIHTSIHTYILTYITLHYIALHYITSHYITLHYIHTYMLISTVDSNIILCSRAQHRALESDSGQHVQTHSVCNKRLQTTVHSFGIQHTINRGLPFYMVAELCLTRGISKQQHRQQAVRA